MSVVVVEMEMKVVKAGAFLELGSTQTTRLGEDDKSRNVDSGLGLSLSPLPSLFRVGTCEHHQLRSHQLFDI